MNNEIHFIKNRLKILTIYSICISIILLLVIGFLLIKETQTVDILRAKGIVIVDENGLERILIGAPIPNAVNRIRTDSTKARNSWAKNYPDPDVYMGYYQNYNHTTNGILILDEQGYDRIAIGDPTPDPNIGKRIAPATGIAINDSLGFERSGWGFFDQLNRIVLGLDGDRGNEGVILAVFETDSAGLVIITPEGISQR